MKNMVQLVAQHTLRACEGNPGLFEYEIKFGISVDLNKCLKQIKLPNSLDTSAPNFDIPYSISSMGENKKFKDSDDNYMINKGKGSTYLKKRAF